ncbi:MAG: ankyrin repeat domain-containing protein [Bryobacterales bacterium]|nr:ankyrin repeat domain-containing protein [Bryobacterales bacterium]
MHHPGAGAASFSSAFDALQAGDLHVLKALLESQPQLLRASDPKGNTLLNLAVSTAGTAAMELLLAAGADPNDANQHGWTPLHQAAYSNQPQAASLLLEAGAALHAEARGSGGTPLIVGLFWGHRDTAALLARHGVMPNNLRAAAGLGDLARVEACFGSDGALTAEACAARGFYRPHSGFPEWQPSSNPREVLDEALVWACKSDAVAVLDRLLAAGARLDADPYRGTPLLWAAYCNRLEAAGWLVRHGAPVNQQATFGGLTHGQGIAALHLAAQCGHLEMVKLLVEAGADRSLCDHLYKATPLDMASHFQQQHVQAYLRCL